MLANMKRQFTELLSDIGFVEEGLTSRDIERRARDGSDGVRESTGQLVRLSPSLPSVVNNIILLFAYYCLFATSVDCFVYVHIL